MSRRGAGCPVARRGHGSSKPVEHHGMRLVFSPKLFEMVVLHAVIAVACRSRRPVAPIARMWSGGLALSRPPTRCYFCVPAHFFERFS
ncbi:unnamed protein product [Chondrus crispus]|uniref:Uncharacterized protein n=1 Tax=Chondrus crispus TaxID=2769 RepID=R7Q7R4_CHOCR|nr:unnamed protein product [Chondrus crispus]CDF33873.1 unnamed protein product [Chondrus crispus]|eukprot:XP_005713692.1 unnamed protein product [Chondrus crispus]